MSSRSHKVATSDINHSIRPDRLTIFAFFWACQALVHQEFFNKQWLPVDNYMGWTLTGAALLVLLFPRSLTLFSFMLTSSIVYNIGRWPYVVNHILLETLIDFTILIAIAYTYLQSKSHPMNDREFRKGIFEKFAPVLLMFVLVMYWFIVNTKTNVDFFNLAHSCISHFYMDVTDRIDFIGLPEINVSVDATPALYSLWIFMGVEVLIPLGLMFKKTRYLALLVGVPFHMLLAIIGHRTFSGFILALYTLVCADSLAALFADVLHRVGEHSINILGLIARISLVIIVLALLVLYFTGSEIPDDIFKVRHRYYFFIFAWSIVGGLIYLAILHYYRHGGSEPTEVWTMSPKWLWLMMIPLMINGFSPFLGFKTETSFAMYSNLKTEGTVPGNHMFLPTINLVDYQQDLVNIIDTDHVQLMKWIERVPLHDRSNVPRKLNVVFFEFNRVIAEAMAEDADVEFFVTYSRNDGEVQTFRSSDPGARDADVAQLEPFILRKLMFYRTVFAGEASYCQH